MENYFVMLIGLSGSGKTTFAHNIVNDYDNAVILSSDEIRKEIYGDESVQRNPSKVFRLMTERAIAELSKGNSVIFDATNLRASQRITILDSVHDYASIRECCVINTPIDQCVANQQKRERKVPYCVIKRQADSYEEPQYAEGWDKIMITEYANAF